MRIFISHASEDKEAFARPLAEALREHGYDVWYDEFSLKLGDSIGHEIDRGLANCDYGVVILSKSFFSKKWPQKELAGLLVRETTTRGGENLILPIWHNVSRDDVAYFSPTLADRIAVSTEAGLRKVIAEIDRVTQFLSKGKKTSTEVISKKKIAKSILNNIIPAGPIQPDNGLMPKAIQAVEDLVNRWDEYGELHLLVKCEPMTREMRIALFNNERYVFLDLDASMHQVMIDVRDLSYHSIGVIWTPPNYSDRDYHMALEFFLSQMGLFHEQLPKFEVIPIIDSDDSFWIKVVE